MADAVSHTDLGHVFGGLAALIVAARAGGHASARWKLPAVLGELTAGLVLGGLATLGISALDAVRTDAVVAACAEIGVLVLMFEVGLEADLREMANVGRAALAVAIVGVVVPLALGVAVSAVFAPRGSIYTHLFVGATLAATSVGITARVLQDLGRTQTIEARIILAAAVVDDVLGLVLLALIAAFVRAADRASSVSGAAIVLVLGKAVAFLVLALTLGRVVVPWAFRVAARTAGKGALITTALALCFGFGFAAERSGLAPAVGAFLAGLAIRPGDYDALTRRGEGALEEPLGPIAHVFVPLFFVLAGARVDLRVFTDPTTIAMAAVLTLAAIAGKLVAGYAVRTPGVRRLAVGIGMVPRGEVGLIFASVGAALTLRGQPVISRAVFTSVIVMVMVTSLLPPLVLGRALRPRAAPSAPRPSEEAGAP